MTATAAVLVPAIESLLQARTTDDVRAVAAHATRLVSRYETMTLYEVRADGELERTLRHGTEISAGAAVVEQILCEKAAKTGHTISTIDRFADRQEQAAADDFAQNDSLALVRPLVAYGSLVGCLALQFRGRTALAGEEFDALRRLTGCIAVSLANALTREELSSYAYADPLTGLANRRRLEAEFDRLRGTPLSLLLIDFDGLKAVNDALGYESGDALIQRIGVALTGNTSPDEFVVRFGGDEFVILMPDGNPARASGRAEELMMVLDRTTLPSDLASHFRGASVGWATAGPDEDPWQVLQRAAAEMRSRKRRRNTDRELAGNERGVREVLD